MSKMLTAYCMKTKEKNVPMQDAVITKTSRGGYMAQGHDGKGNKMTTMLSEANALQAVKDGVAKKRLVNEFLAIKKAMPIDRYRFFIYISLISNIFLQKVLFFNPNRH